MGTGEDVGVDHRCLHALVPQKLLDGADVVAILKEVGGVAVAERVWGERLVIPARRAACLTAR